MDDNPNNNSTYNKMQDNVNHPKHYTKGKIEPIDFINANDMDYLEGNIVKYIARYKYKGGVEDLEKAEFYLRMLLDYFIMYNLMELQNPGSLRRMESRMKKDNNQEFYISPKRVIPRGGTINIGEIISNMHKEATR